MRYEIADPCGEIRVLRAAFLLILALALALGAVLAALAWRGTRAGPPLVLDNTINPNTASVGSLLRLPGVGLQRAQAIVARRQRVGQQGRGPAFRNLEDLEAVPGLGPATVQAMAPYLRFADPRSQGVWHAGDSGPGGPPQ